MESGMNNSIEIYQSDDGQVQLEIKLQQESLWLTQAQISELFDTSTDNVSLHLKNVYIEQELDEKATSEDFSVVGLVPTLPRGNAYGANEWVEVAIQSLTLSKHTLLH
jgi:hypothetical protein